MLGIVVSVDADVVVHRRPTTPTWASKEKESRQDLEPNPNIDFLPSSKAAPHTRPTSAKPNRGGGRCGDSEGWICLLRRIVTLWSNRRLDIETKASCSTRFRGFSGDGWGGPEDAFRLRVGEDSWGGHEGCSHPPTGALPHKSTSIGWALIRISIFVPNLFYMVC